MGWEQEGWHLHCKAETILMQAEVLVLKKLSRCFCVALSSLPGATIEDFTLVFRSTGGSTPGHEAEANPWCVNI